MVQCTHNILSQWWDPDKEQREEFLHETFGRKRKYFYKRYLARKYKNSPRGTFFSLAPQQPFCSPFQQGENIDDWIISIRLVNWNWENWRNRLNHDIMMSFFTHLHWTTKGSLDQFGRNGLSLKSHLVSKISDLLNDNDIFLLTKK